MNQGVTVCCCFMVNFVKLCCNHSSAEMKYFDTFITEIRGIHIANLWIEHLDAWIICCKTCVWNLKCDDIVGLCVQVMVTNVTSLLKTVKAVEDEHSRGTRALEATIEAIGQEIRVSSGLRVIVEQIW